MTTKSAPANRRKTDLALQDLLSRQNYLVVEANDLARAFGKLDAFEQNMLDYSISFIQPGDQGETRYTASALDVLHHFGLNASGFNYRRVYEAFKALNDKTPVYLDTGKSIMMTHMFSFVEVEKESGAISFEFSKYVQPLLFELKDHYHSFKLSELAALRSKHSKTLLRLWRSKQIGSDKHVVIKGSLEEWQLWFRGKDVTLWPSYQFKRDVLDKAMIELSNVFNVWFTLNTLKRGRKVVGYELTVHDDNSAVLGFGKEN